MSARRALGAGVAVSWLLIGCATPAPAGWTPGAPPELLQHVPPGLRYVRVDLPPEQNGFVSWMKAAGRIVEPDVSPELKSAWFDYVTSNDPFPGGDAGRLLSGHLDRNREAVEQLVSSLRQERWQSPPITNGVQFDSSYLRTFKDFMNLKDVESRRALSRELPDAAAQSVLQRTWPCRDRATSDDWRKLRVSLEFDRDRLGSWMAHGLRTAEDVFLAKVLISTGALDLTKRTTAGTAIRITPGTGRTASGG
jgi:hypothetical protein